jgi:hypothetical protein
VCEGASPVAIGSSYYLPCVLPSPVDAEARRPLATRQRVLTGRRGKMAPWPLAQKYSAAQCVKVPAPLPSVRYTRPAAAMGGGSHTTAPVRVGPAGISPTPSQRGPHKCGDRRVSPPDTTGAGAPAAKHLQRCDHSRRRMWPQRPGFCGVFGSLPPLRPFLCARHDAAAGAAGGSFPGGGTLAYNPGAKPGSTQ